MKNYNTPLKVFIRNLLTYEKEPHSYYARELSIKVETSA